MSLGSLNAGRSKAIPVSQTRDFVRTVAAWPLSQDVFCLVMGD